MTFSSLIFSIALSIIFIGVILLCIKTIDALVINARKYHLKKMVEKQLLIEALMELQTEKELRSMRKH